MGASIDRHSRGVHLNYTLDCALSHEHISRKLAMNIRRPPNMGKTAGQGKLRWNAIARHPALCRPVTLDTAAVFRATPTFIICDTVFFNEANCQIFKKVWPHQKPVCALSVSRERLRPHCLHLRES